MTESPKFGEYRVGWWQLDGYWYVTRGAAFKAFHITEKQFLEILKHKSISACTLTNPHNNHRFTVYNYEQLCFTILAKKKGSRGQALHFN